MTTAHLYFPSKIEAFEVPVDNYVDGIALLQCLVNDLLSERGAGFAFTIHDSEAIDFPTLHFQQCENGCILQVYASDYFAIDGKEGWHTLIESDDVRSASIDDLVKVDCDIEVDEQFQQLRFAKGVWFSNKLLVNTDTMKRALSEYVSVDAIGAWLRAANWINLRRL